MKISYSKNFVKQYSKQSSKIKEKFIQKQYVFVDNVFNSLLNNHSLHGEYAGCRSINITGDIRAVFEEINSDYFEFIAIGTHSELFS